MFHRKSKKTRPGTDGKMIEEEAMRRRKERKLKRRSSLEKLGASIKKKLTVTFGKEGERIVENN